MPSLIEKLGLNTLSMQDRLALIDELLESVATDIEAEPVPEDSAREFERGIAALAADRSRTTS